MKFFSYSALIFSSFFVFGKGSSVFAQQAAVAEERPHCHACSAAKARASQTWSNQDFSINHNSRNDSFQVTHYHIHLKEANVTTKAIKAEATLTTKAVLANLTTINFDLYRLPVDSIKHIETGNNLTFTQNDSMINVQLPAPTTINATNTIKVYYGGIMATDPSWGGAYAKNGYLFTMGVGFASNPHNYGRIWYPCFDNFRNRATYTIAINTTGTKVGHANGLLVDQQTVNNVLTRTWELNTPIPTYLSAFAIADYATISQTYNSTLTGVSTPIELVSLASDTTNFKNSFVNLNKAIEAYEYWFGPYNWEKVGYTIVPFDAGAMEHATNIAYPKYAINGGTLSEERLMAHELSHHWWGDWITCETAEDMWINEGMASYCEHLFMEYQYGAQAYKNAVNNNHYSTMRSAHTAEGGYRAVSGVPHQYTYGRHVYDKGATVGHNLRWYMTDSLFRVGMKKLMQNNALSTINSEQMRDSLNLYTGLNLDAFFNDWVLSAGYPHFEVSAYSSAAAGNNTYNMTVNIEQKLIGRIDYHTNVPLMLSVYGNNAGEYWQGRVIVSGQNDAITINIPFQAKYVFVNENQELAQGRYDANVKFIGAGNLNLPNAQITEVKIGNNASSDSLRMFVQYHPVAPTAGNNPNNYELSNNRFWTIHLFDEGQTSNNYSYWILDNTLEANLLTAGLDSLVLLYRPNPNENWVEHPDYTRNAIANIYTIRANTILNGDYAFGKGAIGLGAIQDGQTKPVKSFNIYPNPIIDNLTIDLHLQKRKDLKLIIIDTLGRIRAVYDWTDVHGKAQKQIQVEGLESGTYFLKVQDKNGTLLQSKSFIKQ